MFDAALYTYSAVFAVSLISLIGVLFMRVQEQLLSKYIFVMVGVATGALLGDAFLHLIPEAWETLDAGTLTWVLAGMGIFFLLEKMLHWHHHHSTHAHEHCEDCEEHIAPFGHLIIVSDVLHNVIDGVIIAAGFLISPAAGIATTIAVALHELPQEIGDYGVLIHAGLSRGRALLANFISALSAFIGAFITLSIGTSIQDAVPVLSALAAGAFIYIAMSDLVPELHRTPRFKESFLQLIAICIGIGCMVLLGMREETPTVPHENTPPAVLQDGEQFPSIKKANREGMAAAVASVIDGDTIRVIMDEKDVSVRLIGIDAPETQLKKGGVECFGKESRDTLSSLLPIGTAVRLITDPTQDTYDVYGRLLAYVYADQQHINEQMLHEGAAREYTYRRRAYSEQKTFLEAQTDSQKAGVGLWAMCK